MRDLTMHELDAQLAEQLPARELMQPVNTAVAIGAVAVNVAVVNQINVNVGDYVSQTNAADIYQSATATNSGDVTAVAASG
jgi:hypothetical protein